MSAKKGHGTEQCATWRLWRRREWSDARSAGREGRRGGGKGRDARTGGWWGGDGERCGEGREEKGRGWAPRVEGDERGTGVDNLFWKIDSLYTNFCGTKELYCMFYPTTFSYKESTCEISCTGFCTVRGYCLRKRGVRIILCTKRPHQINRTLYHGCTFCCKVIVGPIEYPRPIREMDLFQGPTLAWYEDCASWLDKSTWQVITCQVIWRGQGDKSTCQVNLSSWLVCQVELVTCHVRKKFASQPAIFFLRIAIASKQVFARFFGPFFACCSLFAKRVFGWTRCEIWPWHNPPSTSFSLYKQSRSDTGSTQKIGINKERESERFSHQRCRTSQWNCWLWAVYMFPESKIFLPDENLRSFNLD